MEQSYKKRPPRATANSPPGLPDIGENYFINLVKISKHITTLLIFSLIILSYYLHFNYNIYLKRSVFNIDLASNYQLYSRGSFEDTEVL